MPNLICSLGALAIANIYYAYRYWLRKQQARNRQLRERVTYMLWTAAQKIPS